MSTEVRGFDPIAVQRSTDGSVGISAKDMRLGVGALFAQYQPNRWFSGVVPQGTDPATKTPAGLIPSVTSPASMQIKVSTGQFVVQSDAAGTPYVGGIDQPALLDVPTSNPQYDRIDRVIAFIEDKDAGLGTRKGSFVKVLDGVPEANPVAKAVPDGATSLGTYRLAANAPNVSALSVARSFAVAVGGVRPIFNGVGLDEPGYPSELRTVVYDDGAYSVEIYSAKSGLWEPIVTKRTPWTPNFISDQGPVLLGNGGYTEAYYVHIVGGMFYVYIRMYLGDGCDAGYGSIRCQFPPGYTAASDQRMLALARVPGAGAFDGQGSVSAGSANITPVFPVSKGDCSVLNLRSADGGYNPGTGVPLVPGAYTLTAGFDLIMSGTILSA